MKRPGRAKRAKAKAAPDTERLRALAEEVRAACVTAALEGYEDAAIAGLCHEGAFEAAVSAMRRVDLDGALRGTTAARVKRAARGDSGKRP